jgi:cob(I)alamin adenosyltransferase
MILPAILNEEVLLGIIRTAHCFRSSSLVIQVPGQLKIRVQRRPIQDTSGSFEPSYLVSVKGVTPANRGVGICPANVVKRAAHLSRNAIDRQLFHNVPRSKRNVNPPSDPTLPHGLLIVHTGNGKGKTSAALNMVYRHLAHGKSAAVIQFIKRTGDYAYGDQIMLERLAAQGESVSVTMLGTGFSWNKVDIALSRQISAKAWNFVAAAIADPEIDLVVCDELHIALHHGFLDLGPVMSVILSRRPSCHVVTTGRYAPDALIQAADLVTDFVEVKHPLKAGVGAQPGIEY